MGDYHLRQEITRTNYRDITTDYNRSTEKVAYLPHWFLRTDISKLVIIFGSGLNSRTIHEQKILLLESDIREIYVFTYTTTYQFETKVIYISFFRS